MPVAIVQVALAGAVVTILALVVQMVRWKSPRCRMSRRHRTIRVLEGIILVGLLGMVVAGGWLNLSGPWATWNDFFLLLLYWLGCLVLVMFLVVLALLDVREAIISYAKDYAQITRGLLEEEQRKLETR